MSEAAINVFFSYSHQDEEFKDELVKHLSILQRQGVILGWHDRMIAPGSEWDREINAHLSSADIILLMISSDFLASSYCWGVEVQKALQRHEAGEACVIPVVLRRVLWQVAPFAKLQALPKNAEPIANWANRDDAFYNVSVGIDAAAKTLNETRKQRQDQEQQAKERARLEAEARKQQEDRQATEKARLEAEVRKRREETGKQPVELRQAVEVLGLETEARNQQREAQQAELDQQNAEQARRKATRGSYERFKYWRVGLAGIIILLGIISLPKPKQTSQPVQSPTEVSPSNVFKVNGETCLPGSTLVTYHEALENVDILRQKLGSWDIARLADGGSMSGNGAGYDSKIREKDPRPMGNALCKKLR